MSLNKQYMKIHIGYQKLLVVLQSQSYNWDSNSAKGDFFRDFDLSFMMPESTAFNVSNWFFRTFMTVGLEILYFFHDFSFVKSRLFGIFYNIDFFFTVCIWIWFYKIWNFFGNYDHCDKLAAELFELTNSWEPSSLSFFLLFS